MSLTTASEIASGKYYNPYDFANPVSIANFFAGRKAELREIRYYLDQAGKAPRPINIVLSGDRSAGKTSLLNMIASQAADRGCCVARINLNEADADPYAFFAKIYDSILIAAMRQGKFGGLQGKCYRAYRGTMDGKQVDEFELLFPPHLVNAQANIRALSESTLEIDLRAISDEVGATIVLVIDECNVLARSRIELEMLRNVFMNLPGFMLAMAGTPSLFPVMEDVFSPIVRQFRKIPVEGFVNVDETLACIQNPLRFLGFDVDKILLPSPNLLAQEVHRIAHGRPYEIQLLCHFMYKRVEQGDANSLRISLDLLDDVKVELEKQASGVDHGSLDALPRLSKADLRSFATLTTCRGTFEQLKVIAAVAGAPLTHREDLEAAYDRLAAHGLLSVGESGEVTFAGDQFDEVYARYFAAAQGIWLSIADWEFQWALAFHLRSNLARNEHLAQFYFVPAEVDTPSRLQEALTLLLEEAPSADSLSEIAEDLYGEVWEAIPSGRLVVAHLVVRVLGEQVSLWLRIRSGDTYSLTSNDDLNDLKERIEEVGGTFEAFTFEYDLPTRPVFFDRVSRMLSRNQQESFADKHTQLGLDALDRGNVFEASQEFDYAMKLWQSGETLCRQAYMALIAHKWEEVIPLAEAARAYEVDDLDSRVHFTFATYDLAIAQAMLGDFRAVRTLLEEVKASIEYFEDGTISGYVACLDFHDGTLEFVESGPNDLAVAVAHIEELLPSVSAA